MPHELRSVVAPLHNAFTTAFMGSSGISNGALLVLAAGAGFDAIVTLDRGMQYQQDTSALPLAVVVLVSSSNKVERLRPLYPALLKALERIEPCDLVRVDPSEPQSTE